MTNQDLKEASESLKNCRDLVQSLVTKLPDQEDREILQTVSNMLTHWVRRLGTASDPSTNYPPH